MTSDFEDEIVNQDREDLSAVLSMRFGAIPVEAAELIANIHDPNRLQRLILAACNAPEWSIFFEELQEDGSAFKLTGERFNPITMTSGKG